MNLHDFASDAHAARRRRLAALLGDTPALIPAGGPVSRNYPAELYPYRASSHFLYLVGLSLPNAMILLEGDRCTLFVPKPAPDDALWHGAVPGADELAEATGCRVRFVEDLSDALGGKDVTTLPAPDTTTRMRQCALLGREVVPGQLSERDQTLARAMVQLRLVHDEAALSGLRRAAVATAAAHEAGMAATLPGATEAEILAAMEAQLTARNMTTSFRSIVTVRGDVLHNTSHAGRLQAGELLLADLGAETGDGWAGDVTRTWPVTGTFSQSQRELYEVVLDAQKRAIAAIAPGVRYRDVHLTACRAVLEGLVALGIFRGNVEQLLDAGAHALFFPHGLGHLLGLDVHDMEDLGDLAGYADGRTRSTQFGLCYLRLDRDLAPGMAVTVEPGIYRIAGLLDDPVHAALAGDHLDRKRLAQFGDVRGIRIEDDVLVTASGAEVLTESIPKEVAAIETAVGQAL